MSSELQSISDVILLCVISYQLLVTNGIKSQSITNWFNLCMMNVSDYWFRFLMFCCCFSPSAIVLLKHAFFKQLRPKLSSLTELLEPLKPITQHNFPEGWI